MGWNSWDSWGSTITESEFRHTARWLHENLQRYGWQYVIIDDGWFEEHPENSGIENTRGLTISVDGRYIPAINRFPSSANGQGLKPLADYVHRLGLKFGIHIIHGIPREAVEKNLGIAGSSFRLSEAANPDDKCEFSSNNYGAKANAAGQAYYDSIARLYAEWGVDLLKVDCIGRPYSANNQAEIHMMDAALRKTGRPIVLSISPGPIPLIKANDVGEHAELWRISDDVWDVWSKSSDAPQFPQSLRDQFSILAAWASHIGNDSWPDADMLPIGYLGPRTPFGAARNSHLTHDEEQTMMTLWCIARSPLILGTNLLQMDSFTKSLLTNPEILAVDQHSAGNKPVIQSGDTAVWAANMLTGSTITGSYYIALFNLGDNTRTIAYTWPDLGLPPGAHLVRDLWKQTNVGQRDRIEITLRPHSSVVYAVELR